MSQTELELEVIRAREGPLPYAVGDIHHVSVKGSERALIEAPMEIVGIHQYSHDQETVVVRLIFKALPT